MSRQLVSETRAAREVGVSIWRFRRLVRDGVLPGPWLGSTLYDLARIRVVIEADSEPASRQAEPIRA